MNWSDSRRLLVPASLFVYALTIRTWGITRTFWMYYDQIRDWSIALLPMRDLPLHGPITHLGGAHLGPAFYWVLWAIRVTLGPWFDNLPHAGGIGQAILHATADVLLFLGIRRRTGSLPLALAVVLIIASAPYDLALSRTIWNPMLAVTFAKMATALVLLGWGEGGHLRAAITACIAWAGLQSHLHGAFVAASILTYLIVQPLVARGWRIAAMRTIVIAMVVAVMQIPWLIYVLTQPPGTALMPVGDSLVNVVTRQSPIRLTTSIVVFARAFASVQGSPWKLPWLSWVLAPAAVLVILRRRGDLATLAVSVGPLVLGCVGFALWTGGYHEYYYLSLMPAAVLTLGLAATSIGSPTASLNPARGMSRSMAILLLVLAVAVQSPRLRYAALVHRMHEYRPLLHASRTMAARKQPLRRIEAAFIAATSSSTFLYEILGGRLSPDSPWIAVIEPDGDVRYERSDAASR